MTRVNVPIEMNEDLYDKMQELCEELGLDMDTAIGIFAQKMVNEEGMPFEVTERTCRWMRKPSGGQND